MLSSPQFSYAVSQEFLEAAALPRQNSTSLTLWFHISPGGKDHNGWQPSSLALLLARGHRGKVAMVQTNSLGKEEERVYST